MAATAHTPARAALADMEVLEAVLGKDIVAHQLLAQVLVVKEMMVEQPQQAHQATHGLLVVVLEVRQAGKPLALA